MTAILPKKKFMILTLKFMTVKTLITSLVKLLLMVYSVNDKCSDRYPGQPGRPQARDLPNFDDSTWHERDGVSNREQALLWKDAKRTVERRTLEQQYGTRYSELHRLEYLDLVNCTMVDALHNLYLGTANRLMTWWKTKINPATGQVYLSNADFKETTLKAKNIFCTSSVHTHCSQDCFWFLWNKR
jgi:hypothetical protein